MTEPERDYVAQLLATGALLENDAFYIAEKILRAFLVGQENALLILDGLPRHSGQATALEPILDVVAVVHLQADAATICERLRRNSGGDRTGRTDDDLALVERKLAIFTERTLPLWDHYRRRGALILTVPVTVTTTPAAIALILTDTLLDISRFPVASKESWVNSIQLTGVLLFSIYCVCLLLTCQM